MSLTMKLIAKNNVTLISGKEYTIKEVFDSGVSVSYVENKLGKYYTLVESKEILKVITDYMEEFANTKEVFVWPEGVTEEQASALEIDYFFGDCLFEPEIIKVKDLTDKNNLQSFILQHVSTDGWTLEWSC